jgi:competence protein ComEC
MQLAFWAASLALGIAAAVSVVPWAVALLAAGSMLGAVVLAGFRAWSAAVAAVALACGLGLGWGEMTQALDSGSVVEDRLVLLTGEVARGVDVDASPTLPVAEANDREDPRHTVSPRRCHLRIAVRQVDDHAAKGVLSLLVLGGVPELAPGDWVRFGARLYRPHGFANPDTIDARLLARGQGIDLIATIRDPGELRRIDGPMSVLSHCRRWAAQLRRAMARAISGRLQEPAAGFVRTMVVGERSDVPEQVEDGFRAAGATHVLSVSGLHLAVVVALFFQAAKWVLARCPSLSLRVPAKVTASVMSLPACFFYTLLTGEAVATVRSAIMAAVVLGASIVNRPVSLPAGIAAAALAVLVQSPLAILDVSFQLSFVSVIGLGLFARWLLSPTQSEQPRTRHRARKWLLRSFSASFAASLVTAPLVAHHFGELTPAAPLGNLVLVPIVELLVLPCGMVGALLALAHSWLGALPLLVAGLGSRLALFLAELFRRFAPLVLVRYPDWCETLLLVASASCLLQAVASRDGRRRRWILVGVLGALFAGGSVVTREVVRTASRELRVTFLDVGQGDSALVEGPRGFAALVDGGGRYDNSFDTGARIVEPVLRARGITHLDLVVLSHAHPDHMNGLFRILRRFPVGMLWQNGDDGGNSAHQDLVRLARERGVSLAPPSVVERDGLTIQATSPRVGDAVANPPHLSANDGSLVVRVRYAGRQILFTGDIGEKGEGRLLHDQRTAAMLQSEVIKVPHHGSRHSSSDDFIDAVSPWLAVVSAGRFNRFGLPSMPTLSRYLRRGVRVVRTDRDGAATLVIDPAGSLRLACVFGCADWEQSTIDPLASAEQGS